MAKCKDCGKETSYERGRCSGCYKLVRKKKFKIISDNDK